MKRIVMRAPARAVLVSVPLMYARPSFLSVPDENAHARSSFGTIVSTWRHELRRAAPSTARTPMYHEPAARPLNVRLASGWLETADHAPEAPFLIRIS